MPDIDLKTETPDTTLPTTGFLFGADSQAAASPSVYSTQAVATTLLGSTSLTGATETTSKPLLDLTQTWNAGAVTFTGWRLNVTDTSSAAGSLLMDLRVGGVSRASINKAGQLTVAGGNGGSNGFSLNIVAGTNNWGFVDGGANALRFGFNNNALYYAYSSPYEIRFNGSTIVTWAVTSPDGSADLTLRRRAAANLQLGAADAAAPVAQTLSVQSVVAGTSNTAGQEFRIDGSQGTGTGAGGSLVFRVAPAGSSGSAVNALAPALTINSNQTLQAFSQNAASYAFSGSSTTGMGSRGAGVLGFYANGSIILDCDSARTEFVNAPVKLSGVSLGFASAFLAATDVFLTRDAANTLALRNGTAAQTFRVYNTESSSLANFERLNIGWDGTGALISFTAGGTGNSGQSIRLNSNGAIFNVGSSGGFVFGSSGANWWQISSSGHFLASTDNTYDIGASGATRPRDLFLGRNLVQVGAYHEMAEMTAPAAPATNSVRIYAEDNGSSKTRLMARFATGAAVQIAIEP